MQEVLFLSTFLLKVAETYYQLFVEKISLRSGFAMRFFNLKMVIACYIHK